MIAQVTAPLNGPTSNDWEVKNYDMYVVEFIDTKFNVVVRDNVTYTDCNQFVVTSWNLDKTGRPELRGLDTELFKNMFHHTVEKVEELASEDIPKYNSTGQTLALVNSPTQMTTNDSSNGSVTTLPNLDSAHTNVVGFINEFGVLQGLRYIKMACTRCSTPSLAFFPSTNFPGQFDFTEIRNHYCMKVEPEGESKADVCRRHWPIVIFDKVYASDHAWHTDSTRQMPNVADTFLNGRNTNFQIFGESEHSVDSESSSEHFI